MVDTADASPKENQCVNISTFNVVVVVSWTDSPHLLLFVAYFESPPDRQGTNRSNTKFQMMGPVVVEKGSSSLGDPYCR
jgi:hypothetical protein